MKTYVVELPQSVVDKVEEIKQKMQGRGVSVKAMDLAKLIEFELTFLDEAVEYCRKNLKLSPETKGRLQVLMERNGFRNTDEAVSFLLDFYETATRRKLLLKELEVKENV